MAFHLEIVGALLKHSPMIYRHLRWSAALPSLLIFTAALSVGGCSGAPTRPVPPSALSRSIRADFDAAVIAFESDEISFAKEEFRRLLKVDGAESLRPFARYYLARIRARKAPRRGASALLKIADSDVPTTLRDLAGLYGGIAAARAGRCDSARGRLTYLDRYSGAPRAEAEVALARCDRGGPVFERLETALNEAPEMQGDIDGRAQAAAAEMSIADLDRALAAQSAGPFEAVIRSTLADKARAAGDSQALRRALGEDEPTPIGRSGTPGAPARLGVIVPLSGRSQRLGRQLAEAAKLFVDEGDGQAPVLFIRDGGSPTAARKAIEELAGSDAVQAAIGLFDRRSAPAAAKAAADAKLPLIMLTLDDSAVTVDGPVWRALHGPLLVARTAAGAALARGGKRAAVIYPENLYGETLGGWFQRAWQGGGGQLAPQITWKPGKRVDWARIAKRVKRSKADTFFVPCDPTSGAQLISHLAAHGVWARGRKRRFKKEKGLKEIILVGPPEWYSRRMLRQAARYLEHVLIPVPFAAETAQGDAFAEAFEDALGRSPTAFDALLTDGLEALNLAAHAAAEVGGETRDALGKIKLDAQSRGSGLDFSHREAVPALFLMTVKDGQFTVAD